MLNPRGLLLAAAGRGGLQALCSGNGARQQQHGLRGLCAGDLCRRRGRQVLVVRDWAGVWVPFGRAGGAPGVAGLGATCMVRALLGNIRHRARGWTSCRVAARRCPSRPAAPSARCAVSKGALAPACVCVHLGAPQDHQSGTRGTSPGPAQQHSCGAPLPGAQGRKAAEGCKEGPKAGRGGEQGTKREREGVPQEGRALTGFGLLCCPHVRRKRVSRGRGACTRAGLPAGLHQQQGRQGVSRLPERHGPRPGPA